MAPGPDERGPRVRVRSRIFPRWVVYQVCGVGPPNMISSQEGIDARFDLRGLRFLRGAATLLDEGVLLGSLIGSLS